MKLETCCCTGSMARGCILSTVGGDRSDDDHSDRLPDMDADLKISHLASSGDEGWATGIACAGETELVKSPKSLNPSNKFLFPDGGAPAFVGLVWRAARG